MHCVNCIVPYLCLNQMFLVCSDVGRWMDLWLVTSGSDVTSR